MKNIYLYLSTFFFIFSVMLTVTACSDDEESGTSEELSIKVYSPTKVIEGQEVIISGTGLDKVTSVVFPGGVSVTDINITSQNQISVITPAGIAPEGGEFTLQADGESVVARVPMTIGSPKFETLSPNDEAGVGKDLVITGKDMEFFEKVIFPGADGDLVVNAIDFERKSTSLLRIKVPKGIKDGPAQIRLVTMNGQEVLLPEIQLNAQAEGEWVITETTVWEGEQDLNAWQDNFKVKVAWFEGIQVGQKVKLYFNQYNAWNQFKFNTGGWVELSLPEIGGSTVTTDFLGGTDVGEFEFTITDDLLNPWFTVGDEWGNGDALIINGEGIVFTKVTVINEEFIEGGVPEAPKVKLWEGSTELIAWNDNGKIELGADMLENLVVGKTLGVDFACDPGAGYWQMRVMGTWWDELIAPKEDWTDVGNKVTEFAVEDTNYEFVLIQEDIDTIVKEGGFLFAGNGISIKCVYVK